MAWGIFMTVLTLLSMLVLVLIQLSQQEQDSSSTHQKGVGLMTDTQRRAA